MSEVDPRSGDRFAPNQPDYSPPATSDPQGYPTETMPAAHSLEEPLAEPSAEPAVQPVTESFPQTPSEAPAQPPAEPLTPPAMEPPTQPPSGHAPTRAPRRRGPGWSGTIAVAILTALATLGASFLLWGSGSTTPLSRSGAEVATQAPVRQASAEHTNWEEVASTVQQAVVAIQVQAGNSGDTGSGVIFDTKGHVLTNYHVIASAVSGRGQITLQLSDGSLYRASVVGVDSTTDLAVLAIENPPSDLQMVTLGSSSKLSVGQPVAAIGAPLGLENTMTTGIISALDRPVTVTQESTNQGGQDGPLGIPGAQQQSTGEQVVTNAIQVDAAINPGNSGGPLFAADGSVIGITSSIASLSQSSSESSGSIGIGFAIPVNLAKSVADQILSTGHAQHAYLGVMIRTDSAQVDGRTLSGASVADVVGGGAADKAGLKKGDLVTALDDHTVTSGTALTGFVRWYVPGDKVKLTYVRDGKSHTTEVTLGTADDQKS
ncbi:trypsin-like peptidase domain-containing protein [Nanchangia anserum]|uniref:Trypsin-like peptidase domain-containing protein n=1 Tax=Nanchangia anserum TaxID=2692125 RepID=A0A8I0KRE8_9ACTO|nr:trypsin-like peptidase domain-containing protein [Nanchangia anserum]MBD3689347.1 trypsin-like peptidase domain-containing protein [Nanchangia anserum]QOX81553.1 trypsin-like peptidase domain-containing protein [Nanchangia anserum]